MPSAIKIAVIGASLAALVACSTDLERLRDTPSQANTDFTRALDSGYRNLAQNEWTLQNDFNSSEYFARKGLRVAKGETVAPERLEDNNWNPDESAAGELAASRNRLTSALAANATLRAPAAAARAQVSYDCWLEEAEDPVYSPENAWKREKVVSCRDEFNAAMAEVDRAMRPAAAPAPAPAPVPVGAGVQRSYLVFFDWDKADVTAEARRIIQQAVASARQLSVTRIEVAGHADRSGSERYNQALSERRSNAVRQGLTADGVPAGQIVTEAFGESRPLVPTADDVREPQNRRVEIVLR
ncbi:MAG TPA: OmpA family protein [Alphaproteobacteria bacterium]|nr:OmpA family protein [Alphaproteobacteria bacterium]